MNWDRGDKYLRGAPLTLEWAGWRSDTATLQYHGWQFAEEVDQRFYRTRFRMKHPETQMYGQTESKGRLHMLSPHELKHIRMRCQLASDFIYESRQAPNYYPVDTQPHWDNIQHYHRFRMGDAPYFRTIEESADIFLKKASMEDILAAALSKQEPERDRIREEMRKRKQQLTTKAQLILI